VRVLERSAIVGGETGKLGSSEGDIFREFELFALLLNGLPTPEQELAVARIGPLEQVSAGGLYWSGGLSRERSEGSVNARVVESRRMGGRGLDAQHAVVPFWV